MARTDGFGRGALHGTLIGAAALAALSLALPLPESGRVTMPATGAGESVTTNPATQPKGADRPQAGGAAPKAQPDAESARAEAGPDAPAATTAQEGHAAPEGPADPAVASGASPDPAGATTSDAPQGGREPGGTGASSGGALATQMSPVPGSEFARAEDLPPIAPAAASAPMTQGQVGAVSAPSAEIAPVPATVPADRPDALNRTEIPQVREDRQTALSAPSAELSLPPTPAAPAPLNDPGQDAGPTPASRAAPVAPDEAEATRLPGREDSPQTPAVSRPSEPDAPVPVTLPDAAATPEAARPAPPGLATPDPSRETVPPPPEPASAAEEQPEAPEPEAIAPATEPAGQGRPAPDLHIPTLPSLP